MFAGHTRPRHAQVLAKEDYGVAMQLARENEEQLPSAPLAPQGRSGAPAPGGEWLADAQRLAQHGRLLTITCVANSRLLSLLSRNALQLSPLRSHTSLLSLLSCNALSLSLLKRNALSLSLLCS